MDGLLKGRTRPKWSEGPWANVSVYLQCKLITEVQLQPIATPGNSASPTVSLKEMQNNQKGTQNDHKKMQKVEMQNDHKKITTNTQNNHKHMQKTKNRHKTSTNGCSTTMSFCVSCSLGILLLCRRSGGHFTCLCLGAHCLRIHLSSYMTYL